MIIAGGGLLFLPACKHEKGASLVVLKNISITAKEEDLLAEIAETMIPATDTPGAKALNLHQFVLKMMDDCYDKEEQKKIVSGLRTVNSYSEKSKGNSFKDLSRGNKLAVLREIGKDKSKDSELNFFLLQTRKWLVKGYETSEYVLTKITPYELVPGRFEGCKKITKAV